MLADHFGDSVASRTAGWRILSPLSASVMDSPALRRPRKRSHEALASLMSSLLLHAGTATSKDCPTRTPQKSGELTPRIVKDRPLRVIGWPTALRAPPY